LIFRVLKIMIEGLQDCFPARIKGVHFIGQPWYVEAFLTVVKPFLKDKSKNKVSAYIDQLYRTWAFIVIVRSRLGTDHCSL